MFKFFKKQSAGRQTNFPIPVFVIASLAVLILFPLSLLSMKSILFKPADIGGEKEKNYYSYNDLISGFYDTSNPLTTRKPELKNLIDSPIIDENDPQIGDKNAPVAIVEYSDFECGFCQKQETVIKKIMAEFQDKIKLIWKDYPESSPASISYQAAVAGRCAGEQGKFWLFHDLLFEKNGNLSKEIFLKLARELKLNDEQFELCLKNKNIKNLIENNMAEADALNITGIPFIFVNKEEIMGEISYEELKKIIKNELKKINYQSPSNNNQTNYNNQ
jgi:protein-disulfide isomerase